MRRLIPFIFILAAAASAQTLTVYSGNGQLVREQSLTEAPFTVAARDARGNPIANLPLTWTITQGSGTIRNQATTTDSNGFATAKFLGTDVPGGLSYTQATITAASSIGSASFYVTTSVSRLQTGGLGAPPLVELITPTLETRNLNGRAGSILPGAVSVRVSIQSGPQVGQLLPNVGVRIFNFDDPATTPSGSCRGGTVLTDSTGVAVCDLVLNNNLGVGQLAAIAGEAQVTPTFFLTITPGTPCTYAITPPSQSFSAGGGTGSIALNTGSGCNWAASSSASWVILSGAVAGSGSANIGFAVTTNTGPARSATVSIASQIFSITQAAVGTTNPLTFITSSPLPGAVAGSSFALQMQAAGGTPPYHWSAVSLPSGLSINDTGNLGGTPSTPGNYSFNVTVNDSAAARASATQTFALNVSSSSNTTVPQITNAAFPSGATGQPYDQQVTYSPSCTTAFSSGPTIVVSSGRLPPGLNVASPSEKKWSISGNPTSAGAFPFALTITEVCGRSSSASFTIVINGQGGGGGGGGGAILPTPQVISFTVGAGTTAKPADAFVNLTSSTGGQLNYTASVGSGAWLSISGGASGKTPAVLSIAATNFQNLPPGSYTGQLAIATTGNATVYVPVILNVVGATPVTATPASLIFTSSVLQAPAGLSQAVQVSSPVPVHFNVKFSTDTNANWLGVSPAGGDAPTFISVQAFPAGLPPGSYTGRVQVAPDGGVPVLIPVTLIVTAPPSLSWSVPGAGGSYLTGGPTPLPITVNLASTGAPLQYQLSISSLSPTNWLSIDSRFGTTPANISLSFDPTGLPPAVYQAQITATSTNVATQPVVLQVSLSVRQAAPSISAILHGASFLPGPLAPGLEIQINGSNLGPVTQADGTPDDNGQYPNSIAGARVLFDDLAAPVLHASDRQMTVLVPYSVAGKSDVRVVAEYRFAQSAPQRFVVADANPGLFTGAGNQAIIFNEDGSYNSLNSGAAPGTVISILGTGDGQTNPPGVDGLVMQNGSLASTALTVAVQINGLAADVVSSTSAPGQPAGVFLIKARVPDDAPRGSVVPVTVMVGSAVSQVGVTMTIAQ